MAEHWSDHTALVDPDALFLYVRCCPGKTPVLVMVDRSPSRCSHCQAKLRAMWREGRLMVGRSPSKEEKDAPTPDARRPGTAPRYR